MNIRIEAWLFRQVWNRGGGALFALSAFAVAFSPSSPARAAQPIRALTSAKQASGRVPPAPGTPNLTAEISAGLGWVICPEPATLPPLQGATSCEGLMSELQEISVTLTPQPVADPAWSLWSGTYLEKTRFNGVEGTLEMLLSYAKANGKTYAFVEGRLFTTVSGKTAVYFGGVADRWDQLQATTAYGPAAPMKIGSGSELWMPYAQFARKGYPN